LKAGWKGASHVVHLCMTVCVVVRHSLVPTKCPLSVSVCLYVCVCLYLSVCDSLSGCSPFLGDDKLSTLCVCVSMCLCCMCVNVCVYACMSPCVTV